MQNCLPAAAQVLLVETAAAEETLVAKLSEVYPAAGRPAGARHTALPWSCPRRLDTPPSIVPAAASVPAFRPLTCRLRSSPACAAAAAAVAPELAGWLRPSDLSGALTTLKLSVQAGAGAWFCGEFPCIRPAAGGRVRPRLLHRAGGLRRGVRFLLVVLLVFLLVFLLFLLFLLFFLLFLLFFLLFLLFLLLFFLFFFLFFFWFFLFLFLLAF